MIWIIILSHTLMPLGSIGVDPTRIHTSSELAMEGQSRGSLFQEGKKFEMDGLILTIRFLRCTTNI